MAIAIHDIMLIANVFAIPTGRSANPLSAFAGPDFIGKSTGYRTTTSNPFNNIPRMTASDDPHRLTFIPRFRTSDDEYTERFRKGQSLESNVYKMYYDEEDADLVVMNQKISELANSININLNLVGAAYEELNGMIKKTENELDPAKKTMKALELEEFCEKLIPILIELNVPESAEFKSKIIKLQEKYYQLALDGILIVVGPLEFYTFKKTRPAVKPDRSNELDKQLSDLSIKVSRLAWESKAISRIELIQMKLTFNEKQNRTVRDIVFFITNLKAKCERYANETGDADLLGELENVIAEMQQNSVSRRRKFQ
eukprot:NODE_112_length_18534_cov_1.163656.p9 type:complete len:313 gc:universal NODE_112_length_18534_cov_1.163656:521-1459(+)